METHTHTRKQKTMYNHALSATVDSNLSERINSRRNRRLPPPPPQPRPPSTARVHQHFCFGSKKLAVLCFFFILFVSPLRLGLPIPLLFIVWIYSCSPVYFFLSECLWSSFFCTFFFVRFVSAPPTQPTKAPAPPPPTLFLSEFSSSLPQLKRNTNSLPHKAPLYRRSFIPFNAVSSHLRNRWTARKFTKKKRFHWGVGWYSQKKKIPQSNKRCLSFAAESKWSHRIEYSIRFFYSFSKYSSESTFSISTRLYSY